MNVTGLVTRALLLVVGGVLAVTLSARGLAPLPDLVLVVVASAALGGGPRSGLVTGLAGGWLLDLLPPGSAVLGTQALLYAAAGLVVGLARRVGPVSLAWVTAVVALAAAGLEVARGALALAQGVPVDGAAALLRVVVTATAALVVVPLVLRLEQRAERRRFA